MAVAIVGGTVIDGLGREPIRRGVVVIEGGRITAVGPERTVAPPRDAERLDAAGSTVLPGIIDCHLHATWRARDMRQHLLNTPSYNILRSTEILAETLRCGVTTARDMGGADAGFRAAIEEGVIEGPRLLVSIAMLSQTGGHADSWVPAGLRVPKRAWLPSPIADGVDDVRRKVREVLTAGADFIKICATGGITSLTDSWDESQYTVEELKTAVEEAAAKNRRVAVHAEGHAGIKNALAAGVYSLEHGWFIDEEAIDHMVRRGTWWIPTLALVPLSVERRKADKAWAAQQLGREDEKEPEILRRMKEQIPLWREAVRRGVNIAMGTDQSHRLLVGQNLVELQYMVDWLGMTPLAAIATATSRAAQCIERPELGALETGRVADILVVEGDPLADIRKLQQRENIRLVMKGGRSFVDRLGRG
jgi:imidazolonepropionase-like amidohydrolase